MGNASDDIKVQADAVTDSHADEGFVKAIECLTGWRGR
jgi:hydroxymethylpyrimidine pyrophosphatase-like HAD family hydrolase